MYETYSKGSTAANRTVDRGGNNPVIDLLSSDDDLEVISGVDRAGGVVIDLDDSESEEISPDFGVTTAVPPRILHVSDDVSTIESEITGEFSGNLVRPISPPRPGRKGNADNKLSRSLPPNGRSKRTKLTEKITKSKATGGGIQELQGGLVLFEDDEMHRTVSDVSARPGAELQKNTSLFFDVDFPTAASSIDGHGRSQVKTPKCICPRAPLATLSYSSRPGPNCGAPYYCCGKRSGSCKFFRWALRSELVRWYRFGTHNGHTLVLHSGFRADDLLQGKVGDCWFLSALAVVAERPDLISRLFGGMRPGADGSRKGAGVPPALNKSGTGIVEVTLFVDGNWTKVIVDNFLPCIIDDGAEKDLDDAIKQSLGEVGSLCLFPSSEAQSKIRCEDAMPPSSYDPFSMSEVNWNQIIKTNEFICQDRIKKGIFQFPSSGSGISRKLNRPVTTSDLVCGSEFGQSLVPSVQIYRSSTTKSLCFHFPPPLLD
mmetsp:Transcript_27020/g.53988  ORF Transcript_27020/g.53988 Transcript_27020/m.53988 type:complete len:486 (+) Transcript_27020:1-1458(+)